MAKRAAVELRQIDDRIITVGPLFQEAFGMDWFVQADHRDPDTGKHITYTADGPFDDVRDAIANAREQAAGLGWPIGSYHVSVDE